MSFYQRRLPHWHRIGTPVFLTWRLAGSLPPGRHFDKDLSSGQAFTSLDRLLDTARTGPRYLQEPAVADMMIEAIYYGATVLRHYEIHAYAVMPNHVHLLVTPFVSVPKLMKSLKGITSKRANTMLGLTGESFWQEESYDRLVRDEQEFQRIRNYIELNPVRAGLVNTAREFRWSSVGRVP